ncbi:MAG: aminotransferase class V-fold PLP-dependent enzyme [Cytophagaceae bacterium]|nr:aminotransferase class V-fold PLP-dependent enzyme [Cytophagaceae bacterium]MDW8456527.1 aminotransferase class V-fold PLP-dependent enzyme [Cytophagaceae bacterium]
MNEAFDSGILSRNHRSPEFVQLSAHTQQLLREKLQVPDDYYVFYTSSATECWEIVAQSLTKRKSLHLFNGSFGEKWFTYTSQLISDAEKIVFGINDVPPAICSTDDTEVICVTQSETSNGTMVPLSMIEKIKENNPHALLAVDATSSMAGIYLPFEKADIWFASVQKCFGLPAGMALLICSPRAVEKAFRMNNRRHYNSLILLAEQMKNFQTNHTPNVLAIFLLNRILQQLPDIHLIDIQTWKRAKLWYDFFLSLGKNSNTKLLISNSAVQSGTVIAIQSDVDMVKKIKELALKKQFILGNGYGMWKDTTFRIANFPAIEDLHIEQLKDTLKKIIFTE